MPIGAEDLVTVPLGGNLYNYSDMTGSTLTAPPSSGAWTVEYDAGTDRTWSTVSWTELLPSDSDISVTAASKPDGGVYGATVNVTNGAPLTINDGRFLMVSVSFARASTGESPVLYDLTIIANRPPVAEANGPYLVGVGGTVPLDGSGSSDPDGDPLVYEWDLDGDGIFGETGAGAENGDETGVAPNFEEFDEGAGITSVWLMVTDPYGASDIDEAMIVIYDPDAGFVTGGGWFTSPEGSCVDTNLCIDVESRANFGFVSKYKKGRSTPDGNTQFQLHDGDLNFHSTSYEWLIIAGAQAKYKGSGMINGSGDYGFMLSATDGQVNGDNTAPDLFRIKIWHKVAGDPVIYDNEVGAGEFDDPSTVIEGGSIVIHKGGKAKKSGNDVIAEELTRTVDLPTEYALHSNYPNPFSGTTTIGFGLPETGHVTLTVYDMLGRRVIELVNSETEAGKHATRFDGQHLPSGMYVYRLETTGGTFTDTMLLLK